MARQRFIWPSIWSCQAFDRLSPDAKVLFIGLFSNADDEGRILADPSYLKSVVWPLDSKRSANEALRTRDEVISCMPKVKLYSARGLALIQLLDWHEHQAPKYPQPSKLPAPRGFRSHVEGPNDSGKYSWNRSGNGSPNGSGNDSANVPLWVGKGRVNPPNPPKRRRRRARADEPSPPRTPSEPIDYGEALPEPVREFVATQLREAKAKLGTGDADTPIDADEDEAIE